MHARVDPFGFAHREQALDQLRTELAGFHHDALVQLIEDLRAGRVLRGSWTGCVLSYRRGAPGSVRRDARGRGCSAFTRLWDRGWITDEEVCAAAEAALAARTPVHTSRARLTRTVRPSRFLCCATPQPAHATGL